MSTLELTRPDGRVGGRAFGPQLVAWAGGVASVFDGITTFAGIRWHGATEANSAVAFAIAHFGLVAAMLGRVALGVTVFVLVGSLSRAWSGWRRRGLFVVAAAGVLVTAGVVLNNVTVLLR